MVGGDRPPSVSWFSSHSAAVTLQLHLWCRTDCSVCWMVTRRLTFQWRVIGDTLLRFLGGLILPFSSYMARSLAGACSHCQPSSQPLFGLDFGVIILSLREFSNFSSPFENPLKVFSHVPVWMQTSDEPFICTVKLVIKGCSAYIRYETKIKYTF